MKTVSFGWLPQSIGGMSLVHQSFMDSFIAFRDFDINIRKSFVSYHCANSGYIPLSRNQVVFNYMNISTADCLLFLDWDIVYQPEDVYRLIDSVDPYSTPIVAGLYKTFYEKNGEPFPCWTQQGEFGEFTPVPNSSIENKLLPITSCGMGFTMIHREVFLEMEKAHLSDPWPWFGHDVYGSGRLGEDYTFCKRARNLGYTVWGHGGIRLGHHKSVEIY